MKAFWEGSESVCASGGPTGRENGGDVFRFIEPVSCEPEVGCDLFVVFFLYRGMLFDQLCQSKVLVADSIWRKPIEDRTR